MEFRISNGLGYRAWALASGENPAPGIGLRVQGLGFRV